MATATSRFGLVKPESNEWIGSQGLPALNSNADKVDSLLGAPVLDTAPLSPIAGQMYLDSADNDALKIWDGAEWIKYIKSEGSLLIQHGVTPNLSNSGALSTITFDNAYASAPTVVASCLIVSSVAVPGPSIVVADVTTTNFKIASLPDGGSIVYKASWVAFGVGA